MNYATEDAFVSLFTGNASTHGEFVPYDAHEEGKKQQGTYRTVREGITRSLYAEHLRGIKGLGICPIDNKGNVKFTVIDVDTYTGDLCDTLLRKISTLNMPLMPFRSKSGGLHLYTFYTDWVKAPQARDFAVRLRSLLGLPAKTEVFPKQTTLTSESLGSWINLPYFGGDESTRCLVSNGEDVHNVELAMSICMQNVVSMETVASWFDSLPLNDAPPCLQSLYLEGVTGNRNNYLFNLAVYFKAKYGDGYEDHVRDANEQLIEPLTDEELEKTVLASHARHSYSYRCNDAPLCDHCDKKECATRTYSRGDYVSDISFEQLIMYDADPPYYEWVVNGTKLAFSSEEEIITQRKFRVLAMRSLHFLPYMVKDSKWTDIVNTALKNMEIRHVEEDVDSDSAIIRSVLRTWGSTAKCMGGIDLIIPSGEPFFSKYSCSILFRPLDFTAALRRQANLTMSIREIRATLSTCGLTLSKRNISGHCESLWEVPLHSVVGAGNEKDWIARVTKSGETVDETVESIMESLTPGDLA